MPESGAKKVFTVDKNGVKQILQNKLPRPGSVVARNGDARFFLLAGVPFHIDVVIGDVVCEVASGISSAKPGKKFCLNARTRVTDNSEEPMEEISGGI